MVGGREGERGDTRVGVCTCIGTWVHEVHERTGSNRCTSLDARLMM